MNINLISTFVYNIVMKKEAYKLEIGYDDNNRKYPAKIKLM
ncbi:hypothetical protein BAOM_1090 [Peribacillus asahii]|uniref:Uncharacterized protein n=1 Tax=Peribacillus asahii TaxID=228899 RepID=A0A3Q9RL93_9BACI|nr:hypothetical protein BAOM_1090 [Peribacillus asahii]